MSLHKMIHFPEPHSQSKKLDFFNQATKYDLKVVARADISKFAKK